MMKRGIPIIILAVFAGISGLAKASVDFTLSSPSAGLFTIGYTATSGEDLMAFALSLSLSEQATFASSCIISVHPEFNGYPDTPLGGYPGGPGDPISQIDLSLVVLDGISAPAIVDNLVTLQIQDGGSGFSYLTLSENFLRGGIIDTDGNSVNATFPEPLHITVPEPATVGLLAVGALVLRKRKA